VLEDRPEYIAADATAADKQRLPFEPLAIVNPRLRPLSDDGARFFEGCLSVPGYQVGGCLGWLDGTVMVGQLLFMGAWLPGGLPVQSGWAIVCCRQGSRLLPVRCLPRCGSRRGNGVAWTRSRHATDKAGKQGFQHVSSRRCSPLSVGPGRALAAQRWGLTITHCNLSANFHHM